MSVLVKQSVVKWEQFILRFLRRLIKKVWSLNTKVPNTIVELSHSERYIKQTVSFYGLPLTVADGPSTASQYKDIFEREIYKFACATSKPVIIDCGANIGLGIVYWKSLYPESSILAFEPDPDLFEILQKNIQQRNLKGVKLFQAAVWTQNCELPFCEDGADGGHIECFHSQQTVHEHTIVDAIRLRDFLHESIDFLKIDIEGAEIEVLNDCRDVISSIPFIFVEFHSIIGRQQHLSKIFSLLEDAGFRLLVENDARLRQPFGQQDVYNGKDLRLNIFAFRENNRNYGPKNFGATI